MPPTTTDNLAFIAVGSNIEPEKYIPEALKLIRIHMQPRACSSFYKTTPLGRPNQPTFVNGVWLLVTHRSPETLKNDVLSPIETQLGRVRTEDKYAPRTIDLDLVLYNDMQRNEPNLRLPHPDLKRPFVHLPVREILSKGTIPEPLGSHIHALLPPVDSTQSAGQALPDLTARLRENL